MARSIARRLHTLLDFGQPMFSLCTAAKPLAFLNAAELRMRLAPGDRCAALDLVRQSPIQALLIGLLGCTLFHAAHAASFNCERALTAQEKLVCADALLSRSDDKLAATYSRALVAAKNPQALRREQQRWISDTRDRCPGVACLRDAYALRTAELASSLPKSQASRGIRAVDLAACLVIADRANRGELEAIEVRGRRDLPIERLRTLFGEPTAYWDPPEYWFIDLDDDRVEDHLAISVSGTARIGTAYARSGKDNALVVELDDESADSDLRVVRVAGRDYVLSGADDRVSSLWRLAEGRFARTCTFTPRGQTAQLVQGAGATVCTDTRQGRQYADYSRMHAVGATPDPERLLSKHPVDGLARVDIDNDGHADNVIRMDFVHGGGRGCGVTYLAVTDDTRTQVPDTGLNKLLLDQLGGYPCGPNLKAFVHREVAYVEADRGGGNITVYKIRNGAAATVCDTRARLILDVDELEARIGK